MLVVRIVMFYKKYFQLVLFCYENIQRAKQELEEIYCDQTQSQVSLDDLGITSPKSKFALQTGYQHQRSLALLSGGGMTETMCHSKVCKEFMDDQFEEVRKCFTHVYYSS